MVLLTGGLTFQMSQNSFHFLPVVIFFLAVGTSDFRYRNAMTLQKNNLGYLFDLLSQVV